jgi:predicted lipoprotein with Yx(FWY)xxD motif
MNRKMHGIAVLAVGVVALVIAGCGGSSSSSSPDEEQGTTVVSLGAAEGVGMVLVESKGMTLYDFRKDKGTTSSCYNACAGFWPPLLTKGEPQSSNGTSASQLGTTERKDGTMQVTYAGHPLYTFVEDAKPGEAAGNNIDKFGGEWYALNNEGEEPTTTGGGGTNTEGESTTTERSGGYAGY